MLKFAVLFCVVFLITIEARPWQFLPPKPGYVPVYIRNGDTPLEEINLDLAEAFHALPSGRSAGKVLDAQQAEHADQPDLQPEILLPEPQDSHHSNENNLIDNEVKTENSDIAVPVERR